MSVSDSVPGEHAYDVKYQVTANIEDALRKFAELKTALEELKRSGGSFDVGGAQNLQATAAAEQALRREVDQTTQAVTKETAQRELLNKAQQRGFTSPAQDYQFREQEVSQWKRLVQAKNGGAATEDQNLQNLRAEQSLKQSENAIAQSLKTSYEALVQQWQRAAQAKQDLANATDQQVDSEISGMDRLAAARARTMAEIQRIDRLSGNSTGREFLAGHSGELTNVPAADPAVAALQEQIKAYQKAFGKQVKPTPAMLPLATAMQQSIAANQIGKYAEAGYTPGPTLGEYNEALADHQRFLKEEADTENTAHKAMAKYWTETYREALADNEKFNKDETDITNMAHKAMAKYWTEIYNEALNENAARDKKAIDDFNRLATGRNVLLGNLGDEQALVKAARDFDTLRKSSGQSADQVLSDASRIDKALADVARNSDDSTKSQIIGSRGALAEFVRLRLAADGMAKAVAQAGSETKLAMDSKWIPFSGFVKGLSTDIDHLGNRFLALGTNLRNSGGGGGFFGGLTSLLGDGAGAFSSVAGGATKLFGAIAPLLIQLFELSVLLPALVQGLGALGAGFLGILASVGQGFAVLAAFIPIVLAVAGVFATLYIAVKPVITAISALASGNSAQAAAALKNLSPAARIAAKDIYGLKDAFDKLHATKTIEQNFFSPILGSLGKLKTVIPPIVGFFKDMATAVGTVSNSLLQGFVQFFTSSDTNTILKPEIIQIAKNLGFALGDILSILGNIAIAVSPIANALTGSFKQGLDNIATWVSVQEQSGGLTHFFQNAYDKAKLLFDIVGNFFGTINGLFRDFKPLGDNFLLWLDNGLLKSKNWSNNHDFTDFLTKASSALSAMGTLIGTVLSGIVQLGGSGQGLTFLKSVFDDLSIVLPPVFRFFSDIFSLLQTSLPGIETGLQKVAQWLADAFTWADKWLKSLESHKATMAVLQVLFGSIGALIVGATALAFLDKLLGVLKLGTALTQLSKVFDALFGTKISTWLGQKDVLGVDAAGTSAAAAIKEAFIQGGESAATAIRGALGTGGAVAGTEIESAEVAGGAKAGIIMAGEESGGGFLGGVTGFFKGGGFTRLLGAAFLGAVTASGIAHAFGTTATGDTGGNLDKAHDQAFADLIGGAVAGAQLAGPPGAIIGAIVGLGAVLLTDKTYRDSIGKNPGGDAPTTPVKITAGGKTYDTLSSASTSQRLGAQITGSRPIPAAPGVAPGVSSIKASLIPAPAQQPIQLKTSFTPTDKFGQPDFTATRVGTRDDDPNQGATAGAKGSSSTKKTAVLAATIYWPNVMTDFNKNVRTPISNGLKNFKATLYWPGVIGDFTKNVHDPISALLKNFKASMYWPGVIGDFTKNVLNVIKGLLTNIKATMYWPGVIGTFTKDVLNVIKSLLTNIKATMYWPGVIGEFTKNVHDPIVKLMTNIKATMYWPGVIGNFTKDVLNPIQALMATLTTKTIPALWNASIPHWFDTFGKVAGGAIGNGLVNAINWAITNVLDNGLINATNQVLGGVGGTKVAKIATVNARFAQGGFAPGEGNTDSLLSLLTPGEFVIRKDAAKALGKDFLNRLNHAEKLHFAAGGSVPSLDGGSSVAVTSAGGGATNGAYTGIGYGNLTATLTALLAKSVDPALASLPSALAGATPQGLGKFMEKAFLSLAQKKDAAALAALGGTIPAGQHKLVIDAALKAAGVSSQQWAVWEAGLNTLITRESGWNASAINTTDSNAKAGHPSQGLAQTIPSTFAAYHVPGTSNNILDPVANVAAAIRYIISRYGSITNVQQANSHLPPKGYSLGGFVMPEFSFGGLSGGMSQLPRASVPSLSNAASNVSNSSGNVTTGDVHFHNTIPDKTGESFTRGLAKLRLRGGR